MTREERLDWLCRLRSGLVWFDAPPKERPVFEQVLSEVIKALEQEHILDKIRTEIENHCGLAKEDHCKYCSYCNSLMGVREILGIIDKYKAESEEV